MPSANIKAAHLHVIADVLTSLTAILGQTANTIWNIVWLEAVGSKLCFLAIINWPFGLLNNSVKV